VTLYIVSLNTVNQLSGCPLYMFNHLPLTCQVLFINFNSTIFHAKFSNRRHMGFFVVVVVVFFLFCFSFKFDMRFQLVTVFTSMLC